MADHPIRCAAPEVRALLAGTKTQKRLVLKLPTKTLSGAPIYERPDMGGWEPTTLGGTGARKRDGAPAAEVIGIWHQTSGVCVAAPIQRGARLWVRETWKLGSADHRCAGYRADMQYQCGKSIPLDGPHRWYPSGSMPRWASRITLLVTDVRVQRLQDISEEDARSEGVPSDDEYAGSFAEEYCHHCGGSGVHGAFGAGYGVTEVDCAECETARIRYRNLWNHINGPGSWESNPWVAAYSFTVHRCNIDQMEAAE